MPSWYLEDADPIAAQNPYTFYKPSRELIARVTPGHVVKLIFRFTSDDPEAPSAERMWVLVDERLSDGGFRGRLNNEPRHIADLKLDDPVLFQPRHVISTEHNDDDNLVERYIKRCFVTKRVLYDGRLVGYLHREVQSDENDSGWRITANDESDEYMSASKNVAYVSLGAVLSCDDSFRELLDAPVGAAFVRDPDTGEFRAQILLSTVDDHKVKVTVRTALPQEREKLEELQRRASLANAGDREAVLAHPEAIELPLQQLVDGRVLVAFCDLALVGFAAVLLASQTEAELDGLFVEPEFWRGGVGRRLLQASCALARSAGAQTLHVIANPHASAFYASSGFVFEREVGTQFGPAARMRLSL